MTVTACTRGKGSNQLYLVTLMAVIVISKTIVLLMTPAKSGTSKYMGTHSCDTSTTATGRNVHGANRCIQCSQAEVGVFAEQ